MKATLNLGEAATLLGRAPDWLRREWRDMNAREGFPRPLHAQGELVWATLHLLAWLDRQLPHHLLVYVQAIRLAQSALADGGAAAGEILEARQRLAERLAGRHDEPARDLVNPVCTESFDVGASLPFDPDDRDLLHARRD